MSFDVNRFESWGNSRVDGYVRRAEQQYGRGRTGDAIADYEQAFRLKPNLSEHAAPFARALHGESAGWKILEPSKAESSAGTIDIQSGGVLVPDAKAREAQLYTIEAPAGPDSVSAVRLEIISQSPNDPKAANSYTNFLLEEFTVNVRADDAPLHPIPFVKAWNDYLYYNSYYGDERSRRFSGSPLAAIDGDPKTAWYFYNYQPQNHIAVFEPSQRASIPAGSGLIIKFQFDAAQYRQTALPRFRLSVHTGEPNPTFELAMSSPLLTGWMKLALARHIRGETASAREALTRAEKDSVSDDSVRKLLQTLIWDQPGQRGESLAAYNDAVELRLKRSASNPSYGQIDHTPQWLAVSAASAWIKREPMNGTFRRHRAETYVTLDQWADAIADYDELIKREPEEFRFYFDRGDCLARLGAGEKARADFAHAAKLNRDEALAAHLQRLNAAGQMNSAGALVHFTAALAIEKGKPGEADLLVRRGRVFAAKGDTVQARADFESAVKINPASVDALLERGLLDIKAGDIESGKADFASARKLSPQSR